MLMKHAFVRNVCVLSIALIGSSVLHAAGKGDREEVNQRIAPVAKVSLAEASAAGKSERSGEDLYKAACSACHDSGAAGAPKLGDKAAWAPRLGQGLAGLLKSATNGKNAMPPKGGSDANEAELSRAIVFMANKSGGNLKEAPAKK